MQTIRRHTISEGFDAVGLRIGTVPMGHVLNIDHFRMSQPTFPPHPHAGFSAVTWMLPWSAGAFINRDSLGDRSRIAPGTLHWTRAGSGILHEEIPELPGTVCEGLQIFVKLPEAEELGPPRSYHFDAADLPTIEGSDGDIRVLVGSVAGTSSSIEAATATTMAHVSARGSIAVEVPAHVDAFAFVLRGRGRIDGTEVAEAMVGALPPGEVVLEGPELEVLVAWSPKMPSSPAFGGPFCMFRPERLDDAARRFRSGSMGSLTASPVAWARR